MEPNEAGLAGLRAIAEEEWEAKRRLADAIWELIGDAQRPFIMGAFGMVMTDLFSKDGADPLRAYALGTALMKTVNEFNYSDDHDAL